MQKPSIDEQIKIIAKGTEEIISPEELRQKLVQAAKTGRQLIIKLGLDPTAPDIHLGHTVVLRKVKQLQYLGHKAVIIIGDFTGMIGDPTGKSKTRKALTREEVAANARTYEVQIFKVLDREKTEIRFNGEWLDKLDLRDIIDLMSKYTVARMLERDDFKKRFTGNQPVSIHEFLYPIMQSYDSLHIKADLELGGTDQKFNILLGREYQASYGQEKQVALFLPILEGTDGVEKMSKSLGNYIGIDEPPEEIYGKIMSLPDSLILRYFTLITDIHPDEISRMEKDLADNKINPMILKKKLAFEIVRLYYGDEGADKAQKHFESLFQKNKIPDTIEEIVIKTEEMEDGKIDPIKLLRRCNFCPNNSEARRLIQHGAFKLNGIKCSSLDKIMLSDGDVIRVGKKQFARIRLE
ncbi:MAG: tyrosine--tRNA ligase [Spirochaetales bacterium]|nr:tyrosine--tRNA ligase [Spirochaetales bacterium]